MKHVINRPISPHLTIYKVQVTSVFSIIHRMTGAFLAIAIYLFCILPFIHDHYITNSFYFNVIQQYIFIIQQCLLFFIVFSFTYHFLNGIRHLIWDKSIGLTNESIVKTSYFVLIGTISISICSWIYLQTLI